MHPVLSSCLYVYFLALTFVSCNKSDQARAKSLCSTENTLKACFHKPPHVGCTLDGFKPGSWPNLPVFICLKIKHV